MRKKFIDESVTHIYIYVFKYKAPSLTLRIMFLALYILATELEGEALVNYINNLPNNTWKAAVPKKKYPVIPLEFAEKSN